MEPASIMPPMNPFSQQAYRAGVMERVLERLKAFFQKFFSISDGEF